MNIHTSTIKNDRRPEVTVTAVPACKLVPRDVILVAVPLADAVRLEEVAEVVRVNEDVEIGLRMIGGSILTSASQVYFKVEPTQYG